VNNRYRYDSHNITQAKKESKQNSCAILTTLFITTSTNHQLTPTNPNHQLTPTNTNHQLTPTSTNHHTYDRHQHPTTLSPSTPPLASLAFTEELAV
jgi:hypothetical protein